jgi:hypothetical protein
MIATDTTNEFGTTVAKDLRTVMQGKVAIAGEASYEGRPTRYFWQKKSLTISIELPRKWLSTSR